MTGQQSSLKIPASAGGWRVPAICLVLAAITFAVFGQTAGFDFVNFDDQAYVYENAKVAGGLSLKSVAWAFTNFYSDNWHPLTWLSHMLDCQLYGLNPGGHHLTNVLLHTATVIALFLVLRQMTGALWRSAFAAAVFAIHPLRVESVAWVAERKDVLSGLFFMLTVGAYVRYARRPWSWVRYGLVVLLFILGLMCKPMLVTLPLVLLLLDYWPLRRTEHQKLSGLVMEKLPLLALSAAGCVVTLLAQNGAIESTGSFSLLYRLGNALAAGMVYLGQMVWPAGLAVFYPYPPHGLPPWEVALAGALLAVLSGLAFWQRRKQPWLLMGWLWYLVMLLPVVGLIQVGRQAHADRYTYLPQIGIYVAVTWLVAERRVNRVILGGLMIGVLAVLMVCAWKQTAYWKNGETLWTRALACTTDNAVAHNSLGYNFLQKGELDKAIAQCQRALQIRPVYAEGQNNLGIAFLRKGSLDEASSHFQQALQINPDNAEAHFNLGIALSGKGSADEAISHFQKALEIKPDYVEAHYNLGYLLLGKGRVDEAIAQYQEALEISANKAEAHGNLGSALLQAGRVDQAIVHFQQALAINANNADVHFNLGLALARKGSADEAISQFQETLRIKPDHVNARLNLGNILLQTGKADEAIVQFEKVLQLDPANIAVNNNLAWLLATSSQASLRNGVKAVELAQHANTLTSGKSPVILGTLAAAFAEAGRFGDAVQTAQKAIELAQAMGRQDVAGRINGELQRYKAGEPFHH